MPGLKDGVKRVIESFLRLIENEVYIPGMGDPSYDELLSFFDNERVLRMPGTHRNPGGFDDLLENGIGYNINGLLRELDEIVKSDNPDTIFTRPDLLFAPFWLFPVKMSSYVEGTLSRIDYGGPVPILAPSDDGTWLRSNKDRRIYYWRGIGIFTRYFGVKLQRTGERFRFQVRPGVDPDEMRRRYMERFDFIWMIHRSMVDLGYLNRARRLKRGLELARNPAVIHESEAEEGAAVTIADEGAREEGAAVDVEELVKPEDDEEQDEGDISPDQTLLGFFRGECIAYPYLGDDRKIDPLLNLLTKADWAFDYFLEIPFWFFPVKQAKLPESITGCFTENIEAFEHVTGSIPRLIDDDIKEFAADESLVAKYMEGVQCYLRNFGISLRDGIVADLKYKRDTHKRYRTHEWVLQLMNISMGDLGERIVQIEKDRVALFKYLKFLGVFK